MIKKITWRGLEAARLQREQGTQESICGIKCRENCLF